jgi:hypothetical protein
MGQNKEIKLVITQRAPKHAGELASGGSFHEFGFFFFCAK